MNIPKIHSPFIIQYGSYGGIYLRSHFNKERVILLQDMPLARSLQLLVTSKSTSTFKPRALSSSAVTAKDRAWWGTRVWQFLPHVRFP